MNTIFKIDQFLKKLILLFAFLVSLQLSTFATQADAGLINIPPDFASQAPVSYNGSYNAIDICKALGITVKTTNNDLKFVRNIDGGVFVADSTKEPWKKVVFSGDIPTEELKNSDLQSAKGNCSQI